MTHLPRDENTCQSRQGVLENALGPSRDLWSQIDPDAGPGRWTIEWANRFLEETSIRNACGLPIQADIHAADTCHYEVAILFRGALAFRMSGYHDWFNILSWRKWPRSKAALNLRHTLHYLAQLERLHPHDGWSQLGRKLPRDPWMQCIAMLDEGGCVTSEDLIREYADLDDRRIYQWRRPAGLEALDRGLHWFGHAVLEVIKLGQPAPRMWVTVLPEVDDDALARRVLTFAPELETTIAPLLERLPEVDAWFREAIRFGPDDPFLKPGRSILAPWDADSREA